MELSPPRAESELRVAARRGRDSFWGGKVGEKRLDGRYYIANATGSLSLRQRRSFFERGNLIAERV